MMPTPLRRGSYDPATRIERELVQRVLADFSSPAPLSAIAAELVAMGISTVERAALLVQMNFAAGGLPETKLGMLIAQHASEMDTASLVALIDRHVPGATIEQVRSELVRQAEAAKAEARGLGEWVRLQGYGPPH